MERNALELLTPLCVFMRVSRHVKTWHNGI